MKKFELKKIVQESLQNICETARAEMSHRLKEDCGLDSLSLVAVIVDMGERLDITFDDGDLDPAKLITVSDLVELAWKSI